MSGWFVNVHDAGLGLASLRKGRGSSEPWRTVPQVRLVVISLFQTCLASLPRLELDPAATSPTPVLLVPSNPHLTPHRSGPLGHMRVPFWQTESLGRHLHQTPSTPPPSPAFSALRTVKHATLGAHRSYGKADHLARRGRVPPAEYGRNNTCSHRVLIELRSSVFANKSSRRSAVPEGRGAARRGERLVSGVSAGRVL